MSDIKNCIPKVYVVHHKLIAPMWEQFLRPIRVGNHNDLQKGAITDNTGDHMADKNREYAELTALYWMWKNDTTSTHLGLWHYRRWMLPDATKHASQLKQDIIHYKYVDWLGLVRDEGLQLTEAAIKEACMRSDVILPYPEQMIEINIEKQFAGAVSQPLLDVVYRAFERLYPDYPSLREFLQQNDKASLRNLMIVRRDLVDNYCNFLFPLLEEAAKDPYIEEHLKGLNPELAKLSYGLDPRWAGVWGERLMAYYAQNVWLKDETIKVEYWHELFFHF